MIEEFPWAMLANGPQWTKAGFPSRVCTRLGSIASLSRRAIDPEAPSCSAVTGSPDFDSATIILPSLDLRSS